MTLNQVWKIPLVLKVWSTFLSADWRSQREPSQQGSFKTSVHLKAHWELFDEDIKNITEPQDARLNSDIQKENRGSMPPISFLGRPLVGPGLYPGTVMHCTVQANEKERRKSFEQDDGKCLNRPLAQIPLGIHPKSLGKEDCKLKQQESPLKHLKSCDLAGGEPAPFQVGTTKRCSISTGRGSDGRCRPPAEESVALSPASGRPAAAAAKPLQSCVTLSDPKDVSPPGSPIPGILQARTLEWVAISFSDAWKWKVKVKSLSCVWLLVTPWTTAHQAPPSMGLSGQECWSGVPLPSLQKDLICH